MKDSTEKTIHLAYLRLIEQKDADKVTVKDIAKESNINRNTFYYHYQDIEALVSDIISNQTDIIISKFPSTDSLEDVIDFTIKEAIRHRGALLHFYDSSNRKIFEQYLWLLCDRFVGAYKKPADEDREVFLKYQKCFLFGLIIDWFNNKMPEKFLDDIHKSFNRLGM